MTVWYTSDLHFGHPKVAMEHRGFDSTARHDAAVANNWNRVVADDDIVYVLGDVAMGSGGLEWVAELRGRKRLIAGNHDAPHPMHRNAASAQRKWLSYFESVQSQGRRTSAGVEFLMAHHPYVGDHTHEDRHTQWRLRDEGVPIVHGHVHSPYRVSFTQRGTKQVHVGLDAWDYIPVREEAVLYLLKLK